MKIEEFIAFHNRKSAEHQIFLSDEAKEFASKEKKVTSGDILEVEKSIGCKLPKNYTDFCANYGGGYFGYTLILSLDVNGEWFMGDILKQFSYFLPKDLVPFADDQAGGFYCFKVQNGEAVEEICYIDSASLITKTNFLDFFDFVISNAYDIV